MSDDQLAIILNTELARQMNQPTFATLMQQISGYEVQVANIRVTNDEEYQMATDSLVAVAGAHKALESMRKEIVAYPNTFVKTVNATFKGLKEKCERVREKLGYHAGEYKRKIDAEFAKQQAEATAAAAQQEQLPFNVDGEQQPPPPSEVDAPPEPPMRSTAATNGAGSVSYRKGKPKIDVVNIAKLVRACISDKNKVPADVISIDMAALRKAVEAGIMTPKKWESYGVKVTETQEMVVRT